MNYPLCDFCCMMGMYFSLGRYFQREHSSSATDSLNPTLCQIEHGRLSVKQVTCITLKKTAPKVLAVSVLMFCKHLLNLASQSQCDLVKAPRLQSPRRHSPGSRMFGHISCSRQHRSSSAYLPTSEWFAAILPGPHHLVPG